MPSKNGKSTGKAVAGTSGKKKLIPKWAPSIYDAILIADLRQYVLLLETIGLQVLSADNDDRDRYKAYLSDLGKAAGKLRKDYTQSSEMRVNCDECDPRDCCSYGCAPTGCC